MNIKNAVMSIVEVNLKLKNETTDFGQRLYVDGLSRSKNIRLNNKQQKTNYHLFYKLNVIIAANEKYKMIAEKRW